MAKQPTIETISADADQRNSINKNFRAIVEKFDEMLSRTTTTDTPNYMDTDLDIADANITNVNRLTVQYMTIQGSDVSGFSDYYVYKLSQLDCNDPGSIIIHDVNGDPDCLPVGANGEVLKVSGGQAAWLEDTDTDTVGVTVQEDGVTVAENVTTINFLWAGSVLATTPASNQVDLDLNELLGAFWQDTTQADTNINPDGPSTSIFNDPAEVVRLDLTSIGLTIPTSNNQWYFIMETSSWLEDTNESPLGTANASGTWGMGIRFYDATGTSTPLTGNQLGTPSGEIDTRTTTTKGGALQTVYCGIPANCKYVDVARADAWLFPLFIQHAIVDNRYRAVVSAKVKNAGFTSPNGIAYPGGVNPRVTPDPSP